MMFMMCIVMSVVCTSSAFQLPVTIQFCYIVGQSCCTVFLPMQDIENERQRLCQEYERQKEAKLDELKVTGERRQMLDNRDDDVSVIVRTGWLKLKYPIGQNCNFSTTV